MNTNDFKIFQAVADLGSFTKAAAATFTVQSNVTARIKSLEDEFGAEFFVRNSRKVTLTAEGRMLMPYARRIVKLVEDAKSSVMGTDKVSGTIKVGCIETTMALKVPEILTSFEHQYPDVELEFKSGMRADLIREVLSFSLDAAFVSGPLNVAGLNEVNVKEENLVIINAVKGPALKDLLKMQPLKIVVFAEGCVFRARLEAYLSYAGVNQYKSTVLNSIEGIINFVEAGLGISLMPEEVINHYYASREIKTHKLTKQLGTMNTVLVFREQEEQSLALKAFIKLYQ
ncbi:LysR family transcriptional regulator [Pedobacter petrophilus]|uniref:LysR family transcriptional regulator n=2 Tax=Pedobacter TaxID=84567 RepID=A0A7K0G4X9_9SPHI|nr:LysR family transcriptional regulator [Pedobacter petrophilus]MRX78863.1 LysR family transcriptional regulator [Pedobacter petrophilus]